MPGRPKLSCVVKDLSLGGALLGLETPAWLPFNFQLTIDATRFTTYCEVRHHRPDAVGVRFTAAVDQPVFDKHTGSDQRSLNDDNAWMGQSSAGASQPLRTGNATRAAVKALLKS